MNRSHRCAANWREGFRNPRSTTGFITKASPSCRGAMAWFSKLLGEDDYYGFNDETAVPDRGEADRAVNTIAGLFSGPASSA